MNAPQTSNGGLPFEDCEETEAAYAARLRAIVAQAKADKRPSVDHDEAMARVKAVIDQYLSAGDKGRSQD